MSKVTYYTKEGFEELKSDLERMEKFERPKISAQIAEARDKGDLSENAEYDAAKEAQGHLEAKIAQLQDLLISARIIDETKLDTSRVHILTTVKLKNLKNDATMAYQLVPERESDIKAGKISVTSPIAKGLMGKKVGDKVEVKVPIGTIPFEIIEIY